MRSDFFVTLDFEKEFLDCSQFKRFFCSQILFWQIGEVFSRFFSSFYIDDFIYEVSVQVVEDFKSIWVNEKKRFSKNRVIIFIHFSAKPRKGF